MKKILISSDPHGRFDLLLPKLHQLHSKNKFDFMLMTGEVCPTSSANVFYDLKNSNLAFPLPTYFIDNSNMSNVFGVLHPEGFELVANLHYLGNIGIKQIQGIRIAYLSGSVSNSATYEDSRKKQLKYTYSKTEAKFFVDYCQNKQVDILLTNQWAQQYTAMESTTPSKNQAVSQICYELSPRYHISASGVKYLRLPAFKGKKGNPTHFINVGQIKQAIPKQKYLVAIQMNPQLPQIVQNIPQNILMKSVDWNLVNIQEPRNLLQHQNQLLKSKNRNTEQKILDSNSFLLFEGFPQQTPNSQITQFLQKWGEVKEIEVFKKLKSNKKAGIVRFKNLKDAEICLKDSGKYSLYQSRIKFEIKQQNQKYRLKDCFLCMGNEKFQNNLMVYKGKFCFVSVDKGPVSDYHFQLVPINHVSSTGELEYEQQQQLSQLKNLYQNHFTSLGYTFVCVERYMNLSAEINHAILHCIPIKRPEGDVVSKFKEVNYQNKFGFEQLEQNKKTSKSDSPYYILVSLNGHKFIRSVDRKDRKFQLGRQVVCEILDKPQRLNWRDCEIQGQKIKQVVGQLKKAII